MKIKFLIGIVLILTSCIKKKDCSNLIAEIKKIETMPGFYELSGDSIYWEIVKRKIDVVPELLEIVDDSTSTNATILYQGRNYMVGEIAVDIIYEIIRDFPKKNDLISDWEEYNEDDAYNNYWYFMADNNENRTLFKKKLKDWYSSNSNKLIWISDNKKYKKSEMSKLEHHPSRGYYKTK